MPKFNPVLLQKEKIYSTFPEDFLKAGGGIMASRWRRGAVLEALRWFLDGDGIICT